MSEAAIVVRGLRKAFGATPVLQGLDLTVGSGSVYALLGPNGAGKTTLVRLLATLVPPDGGTARVAGHDVVAEAASVRRSISLTGQYAAVDELLTGEENLRLMARVCGMRGREASARVDELLATFDLTAAARRRVDSYSGGMRRRLDLAVSLVPDRPVLFLDEPTTGLDTRSRQALWALIGTLRARGTTILLTTQYLEEADRLADRAGVLHGGRLVAEGTPAELKARGGGGVVELAVADPADRARVAGRLHAGVDERAGTVTVPTDGSVAALRRILDELDADGVQPFAIALRSPSLDDAFLVLTGDAAREREAVR